MQNLDRTYLDNNATSPLRIEVREAMVAALDDCGNASSIHIDGQRARKYVENSRKQLVAYLGLPSSDLIFTSGATEACQLALDSAKSMGFDVAIIGAAEHDAIYAYALEIFENVKIVPLKTNGEIDISVLEKHLSESAENKPFVAIQAANNETGIISPISQISGLIRQYGAAFMVDAVQAFGKMKPDEYAGYADWLIISGHKIGGPLGIGALLLAPGIEPAKNRPGGGQERGNRSGTQNTPAIHAFGTLASVLDDFDQSELRDEFEKELLTNWPNAKIFGKELKRLTNTSYFAIPDWSAEHLVIALDLSGVSVSSGSACSSGSVKTSRVLKAMNVDESIAKCAVRVSFGWKSTSQDVKAILNAMKAADLRRKAQAA